MTEIRKDLEQYKLYSVKDLEPVLGRTAQTIKSYLKKGKLKGAIIAGQWKVTEEALREFLGLDPKQ